MVEIKVHCAFVKGGTKSVVLIGGTMWYIFDWKSCNKDRCALAKSGKTVFAQFPKARSIHHGFSY
jgi:hypothetical protein